jgi:sodium/bile acid cotransporter 7
VAKIKFDIFSWGLVLMVLLGLFLPQWSTLGGGKVLPIITDWGISLIFLLYGLKLKPQEILQGLKKWKLHILVQACTFILFPLLVLPALYFSPPQSDGSLGLSLYFMACLPSTVSSSVVLVAIARGDVPSAIFNASISGLIGIVITPLLLAPFLIDANGGDFTPIYNQLLLQILLPLLIGLSLSKWWGEWVRNRSQWLNWFDRSIILLIVYKSFANSQMNGHFDQLNFTSIALLLCIVGCIFFLVFFISGYLANKWGLEPSERITVQYCGSKKSLIHGSVFAQALFGPQAALGVLLLPVLMYHGLQIIVVSMLAQRQGKAVN